MPASGTVPAATGPGTGDPSVLLVGGGLAGGAAVALVPVAGGAGVVGAGPPVVGTALGGPTQPTAITTAMTMTALTCRAGTPPRDFLAPFTTPFTYWLHDEAGGRESDR
jgi:hypothetical protein